ncbi:transporter, LysE family [Bacillus sp. JCM 19047]|nr:transporter, LysE family [Bacillus sp. JCM 19047]
MFRATRLGLKKSFRFNLGIFAEFLLVMMVCTVLSTTLYGVVPKAMIVMQVVGAAYILYLAWKVWKSTSEFETEDNQTASFLSGVAIQFVNPKIYIYAFTAMSLYILPTYTSVNALIGFAFILAIIGASGSLIWAFFGSLFCGFLKKHTKVVNEIMAILLVYCALSFFF